MIIYCGSGSGEVYARSDQEVADVIDQVINSSTIRSLTEEGFEVVPDRFDFSIVGGVYPDETNERWPNNYLYVSVNSKIGYGALRWWTSRIPEGVAEGDMRRFVWTSKGETPPPVDPELIADPGGPRYYEPGAAIPLVELRKGVEEFCRMRTGDRPECISWQLLGQSV
ncbi:MULTISPECIES: Imm1 family immunity protein [unclassified Streptomyces]|uniref:Imm1 family immunity protein n=1 Tax=unclassified Streptomyces TaxID=2593676 RepID=UPI000DAC3123|nr:MULTISPECIES: Imm1 family immunity protein [unclassified Streptomyces]PZT75714.1 hypothetical protein DNK56_19950 [Streptomyces sp. AC1-42W]PZT80333.1 hypothetical protein DNK55_12735 [Streptomyces sp. AC1-42T]